ncbi:MAG: polyphosphate glucokinase [Saprospiraceae bacterium]|jgi:polyphosphate glucokinase
MVQKKYLGIDVGASGIKGAIVDIKKGEVVSERFRIPTPEPSTPKAIAKAFVELVNQFDGENKVIGCGFPSIIKNGIALSAANIHKSWTGTDVEKLFSDATGCQVSVKNDADLAGIGEMKSGVGKDKKGTILFITVGTGLGSALFVGGELVANTELGHLYIKGHNKIAEQYAADSVRKRKGLSWKIWALRFNKYLAHIEKIFSPDLIIIGGGSSKKFELYEQYLSIQTPVMPAVLLNNAGIIGAAYYAYEVEKALEKSVR